MNESPPLLDELAMLVEALRAAPRGSDSQLALIDATSNTLMVFTMQQLGVSDDQVRRLWRSAGLDNPLSFLRDRQA